MTISTIPPVIPLSVLFRINPTFILHYTSGQSENGEFSDEDVV